MIFCSKLKCGLTGNLTNEFSGGKVPYYTLALIIKYSINILNAKKTDFICNITISNKIIYLFNKHCMMSKFSFT